MSMSFDNAPFSGSYRADDVQFLLKPIDIDPIDVTAKERLIQSGQRHYSELLSRESLPSVRYLTVFQQALHLGLQPMARGVLDLAAIIAARRPADITLVSLMRAGTPVGVALRHVLREVFGRTVVHYSLSIIRDRGIDRTALRFILDAARQDPAGLVFVDGWTGKGVIAHELRNSLTAFERDQGIYLDPTLYTLTDLAGVGCAPTDDDYLIPSSILNATVSGLVSRSILNEQIGRQDFHGCVNYQSDPAFAAADCSVWFIDTVLAAVRAQLAAGYTPNAQPVDPTRARARSTALLAAIRARFGIHNAHFIKPGIGEATRVLLRRVPERVIIRDPAAAEVAHLLELAHEKAVLCQVDPTAPYQAISLIKGVLDA